MKGLTVSEVAVPDSIVPILVGILNDVELWAGTLNEEGEHVIDLRSPVPGPHFFINLLLGNRIGYSSSLQTTPKSVERRGDGSAVSKLSHSLPSPCLEKFTISLDALNAGDCPRMVELPNFKQVLEKGSYVKEVIGVYPSLTYPSHISIITGKYPINHGIADNTMLQPGTEKPDWYWYKQYIKVPTLYDLAKSSI